MAKVSSNRKEFQTTKYFFALYQPQTTFIRAYFIAFLSLSFINNDNNNSNQLLSFPVLVICYFPFVVVPTKGSISRPYPLPLCQCSYCSCESADHSGSNFRLYLLTNRTQVEPEAKIFNQLRDLISPRSSKQINHSLRTAFTSNSRSQLSELDSLVSRLISSLEFQFPIPILKFIELNWKS